MLASLPANIARPALQSPATPIFPASRPTEIMPISRLFYVWPVCCLALLSLSADVFSDEPTAPYSPKIAEASDDAQRAIARVRVPEGLRLELVAAEPHLANPVAFCFDERGRIFVAETFRLHDGVTDIRGHMDWLDDDLASRSVEDRLAMYQRRLGDKFASFAQHHDRVSLLEDRDGDGRVDASTVFADGFHHAADGLGAGVLARDGKLWFTCIPDLWLLEDHNGDGRADERQSLAHGFGVHVGFIGHDLHGLTFGPDGKIYFSIGDRGLNVSTPAGPLSNPDSGAVLRVNPDGSELEIFATGLRNPQELAFDQYGNLFTCDNNSDGGDKARWVYVVEGGDSGWRIGYQFMNSPVSRGPWNSEKMWHPRWEGQAAFIVPPLANISNGPSGLCYDPGTGLGESYRNRFFLAEFRGGSGNSGVYSFRVKPQGASFEVVGLEETVWSVLATDVAFGPAGGLYLTDWVEGWGKPNKGRIYRLVDNDGAADPLVAEVKTLLAEGMAGRDTTERIALLAHRDQRVRQAAQFALAEQGESAVAPLTKLATTAAASTDETARLARLHALWALGQIARARPMSLDRLMPLVADEDAEIRAQTCRLLGERRAEEASAALVAALEGAEPRVRFFAAMALGKLGRADAVGTLIDMLRANAEEDAYLRHAGVMALTWINDRERVLSAADDESPAVRMAVLLVLRRWADPAVARFLDDREPLIVAEAARAISETPIAAAEPQLAAIISRPGLNEPALRRAINANFRLGQPEHAAALAALAARRDVPEPLRVESLRCLEEWPKPSGRDRIIGLWRPLAPRSGEAVLAALRPALGGIFSGGDQVRKAGAQLAGKLGIKEVGPELFALANDHAQRPGTRVEALRALGQLGDARLSEAVETSLAGDEPLVRAEARRLLAKLAPDRALAQLKQALQSGTVVERQTAFATLAEMASPPADGLLCDWLDRLLAGQVEPEVRLDLLEAAATRNAEPLIGQLAEYERAAPRDTPVGRFHESLVGGDAERGRRIFFEKAETYCLRCHKVSGQGGEVGPDLSRIAADPAKTREYLLESIVDPNRQIAKGFDSVIVATDDGRTVAGVLKSEDERELRLMTPEGKLTVLRKDEIEERARGKSAMPDKLIDSLGKREMRDLVEYLSTLK